MFLKDIITVLKLHLLKRFHIQTVLSRMIMIKLSVRDHGHTGFLGNPKREFGVFAITVPGKPLIEPLTFYTVFSKIHITARQHLNEGEAVDFLFKSNREAKSRRRNPAIAKADQKNP